MVKCVRDTDKTLEKVSYELSKKVMKKRPFARSLFVVKYIKKGEHFTEENVRSIRIMSNYFIISFLFLQIE